MKFPRSHAATGVSTALVVAAAFLGLGASTVKRSPVQVIYVQNHSTYVSDAELRNALPAFQAATTKDFAPLWHIDAKLVLLPAKEKVPAGAESITLVDKGPVKGALAYHEMVNGVADAIIYTGVAKFYGYQWSVGLTHELWEMLGDAPAGAGSVDAMQAADGLFWARENADPVESDADGYDRPGLNGKPVRISDFVTEKWFGALQAGPYDFMNHVQQPFQIDKGGYAQFFQPGLGWVAVNNFVKGGFGSRGEFYD
jgi:hypothetical protein